MYYEPQECSGVIYELRKHKIFGEELTFGEMEEGRLSFFTLY